MKVRISNKRLILVLIALVLSLLTVGTVLAKGSGTKSKAPIYWSWEFESGSTATLLTTLPEGAYGSTVGPDRALYVTEPAAGRISRVDPSSGEITAFATGLPISGIPFGGVVDVAFMGETAYALVTLVGPDVGGSDLVGIYQITGPDSSTAVADIGTFSVENPSESEVVVPSGVQYAMETYRGGFLVTDGHHNRVLWATLDGEVTEFMAFGNIVPTGLEVRGKKVLMAEAGPIPHEPKDGKVMLIGFFKKNLPKARELASGAPLLVDVEFGRGRSLFALSQGDFPADGVPADVALPDTGALVKVNWDGSFSVVVDSLNLPTSMEVIGNNAYVIGIGGEIWNIDHVAGSPYEKGK